MQTTGSPKSGHIDPSHAIDFVIRQGDLVKCYRMRSACRPRGVRNSV